MSPIKFIDLDRQRERLGDRLVRAILAAVEGGQYIMGGQVAEVERQLASFADVRHVITCANGTDAIVLGLMASGVQSGEAVVCPSFTFAATAGAVALTGAIPVFCDVDPSTYNCTAETVASSVDLARRNGLEVVGLIAVDLFGQPADYGALSEFCTSENIWLASDAAQSFGASYHGVKVGGFGRFTTTSFFPAKPLGCYGDGGAVMTNDDMLADSLRSIRVHGKGENKYQSVRIGMNSRLDTLQAVVLLEKLTIFEDEIIRRNHVAARYRERMPSSLQCPHYEPANRSTWAQYTVQITDRTSRTRLQQSLKDRGIPTAVYYPKPLHQQKAYQHFLLPGQYLPVSEALSRRVISLPMHPYLSQDEQSYIIEYIIKNL